MTLGQRIKAARKRLPGSPSQGQIAEQLGVSTQAVSQWERGEDNPLPERYPDLRKVLKVTYKWLLEGRGTVPAPDSLEVRVEQLPDAERATLEAFLDSLERRHSKSA